MKLIETSINRPVTIFMIALIIVFLGVFSYNRLAVDLMPDVTAPILSVQTDYEGVSSHEIENLITKPVEDVAATIQKVERITSESQEGRSRVTIRFKWGQNLEEMANDLRSKLDRLKERLPDDAGSPVLFKFDLNALPIMWIGISGDMNWIDLRQHAENQLAEHFDRIEGVGQAAVQGGFVREIHVELRYHDLQAKDVTINEVITAIDVENIDIAAGDFNVGKMKYTIRTLGKFKSINEIKEVVVKRINGISITVGDVADVKDGHEDINTFIRVNGKNAMILRIIKQPDANTVEVAAQIRKVIKRLESDPDKKVDLTIIRDTSTFIKRSITNVKQAAILGGIIAIFILSFFLRNVRSTFIIAVSMFISIITTFILMDRADFTLNMMTFGGLALGIGMLVDNSIVVIENIFRYRHELDDKKQAALAGTKEVSTAIIVSTLTTVIVFLPLLFFEGTIGIMFAQLAFMVSFALIASLFVALTVIPAFSSKFLRLNNQAQTEKWSSSLNNGINNLLTELVDSYSQFLRSLLRHRVKTILVIAIFLSFSLFLIPFIGFDYMPMTDEGEISIRGELNLGTNVETTDLQFKEIERILLADFNQEIAGFYTRVGTSGYRRIQGNSGRIRIFLKSLKFRKQSSSQIANRIRKRLSGIKDMKLRIRPSSFFIFRIMRGGGEDRISLEILGHDLKKSDTFTKQIIAKLQKITGVMNLRKTREYGSPEYTITVNRRKAKEAGLSVSELGNYIQYAISGKVASRFTDGEDEHNIRVRIAKKDIKNMDDIKNLSYPIDENKKISLKTLLIDKKDLGPVIIERLNRQRVNYITGNIVDRDSQAILTDIKTEMALLKMPENFSVNYGGIFQEQEEAYSELAIGIFLAVCLVYMVMTAQYESFKAPFVIMFTIPFSFSGVIVIFYLAGIPFDVQGFIGTIMLTGIVVNNSIVMVDFIQRYSRQSDISLIDAIVEAGRKRFRPIIMTSLTTILALVPLAIGLGEGSELQRPMALSVIGGLAFSTIISLFLIPSIYLLFFKKKNVIY